MHSHASISRLEFCSRCDRLQQIHEHDILANVAEVVCTGTREHVYNRQNMITRNMCEDFTWRKEKWGSVTLT